MVLIDGRHESEFGIVQLRGHENPATPDFTNYYESVPGNAVGYDYGSDTLPKPLSIPFVVLDCKNDEAQDRIDNYVDLFFDDFGKPKEVKVIFEEDAQRYYKAKINGRVDKFRINNRTTEFRISLIAIDPYRYSTVEASEVTWGSEEITFESITYTFGHTGTQERWLIDTPQEIEVYVTGLALQPTITIWGKATDLIISANGKKINVGTFANKSWVIDTKRYISYVGGEERLIKMDKFFIRNGVNKISFEGTDLDLDVSIKFRDRWR